MYWHAVWKWLPFVAVPYGLAKSRLAKTQANTILWDAFKINLDYELDEMALKKVLDLGQGFSQQRQSAPYQKSYLYDTAHAHSMIRLNMLSETSFSEGISMPPDHLKSIIIMIIHNKVEKNFSGVVQSSTISRST